VTPSVSNNEKTEQASGLRIVPILAVAAGLVIANNYYNQPLLHEIGRSFGASDSEAALVSTLTQLGYALGLLFLLPLGDMLERRSFILLLLGASALALVGFATAGSLPVAIAIAALVGVSSVVPQLLPPIASQLAAPGQGRRAVATVMGGLLLGIALSRFVGGVAGDFLGWRTVYWIAAGLMVVLLAALAKLLPAFPPPYSGNYRSLLHSMIGLVQRHAELRWLSAAAALQFAAFGLVWTTLAFHLQAMPERYPASVVGMLALIGSGGVVAAMLTGRISENIAVRPLLVCAALAMLAAFALFGQAGMSLAWLVPGVILLDLGMQVSHVTSMARILEMEPAARSRLNTVYMSTRFAGGAAGTAIGGLAWAQAGWSGVCLAGGALTLAAAVTIAIARLQPPPSAR
jgi:predicted MFS family arabinose efflux permease